ncbi:class F sortase [Modestobacter versicolor]|uniref:Class F sortase n=1 Tax=Modestobacter versicolor TaxID=429133 RepID=A0A323VEE9_9ACTN|nr:class F sortase [Modestobacter versicolor]
MRITGAYPPPLRPSTGSTELQCSRVTRYDRSRHRAPREGRPRAAQLWAGASGVLAAAGVAAVLLAPSGGPTTVRQDVPVAAAAAPATVPVPSSAVATAVAPPVLQLPASDPVRVRIPALRVSSTVMDLGLERDGSMEVPPGAYPVGWYDGSPTPGELGPAVLAGHVDWGGEPGAFYGLRELLPGDEVVIDRADGTTATFRVDRVEEHDKDAFPSDDVYGDLPYAGLRLITCGGAFEDDSGDYEDNVIVFASLTVTD